MSKHYSQAFKNRVVRERLQNKATIKSLSTKYAIGASTIHRWLKTHDETKSPDTNLIDVTDLMKSSVKITFMINGYEITCDEHTLPLILEGLGK
jgi:transposase-like protein